MKSEELRDLVGVTEVLCRNYARLFGEPTPFILYWLPRDVCWLQPYYIDVSEWPTFVVLPARWKEADE